MFNSATNKMSVNLEIEVGASGTVILRDLSIMETIGMVRQMIAIETRCLISPLRSGDVIMADDRRLIDYGIRGDVRLSVGVITAEKILKEPVGCMTLDMLGYSVA